MNTTIISINAHVGNNDNCQPQMMTSLEIAELTDKQHWNLIQAIRNMEPAWEKLRGAKFRLLSKNVNGLKFQLVEYLDKKGESRPCCQLTKSECLYIAMKFNDEARAELVMRWEELKKIGVKILIEIHN